VCSLILCVFQSRKLQRSFTQPTKCKTEEKNWNSLKCLFFLLLQECFFHTLQFSFYLFIAVLFLCLPLYRVLLWLFLSKPFLRVFVASLPKCLAVSCRGLHKRTKELKWERKKERERERTFSVMAVALVLLPSQCNLRVLLSNQGLRSKRSLINIDRISLFFIQNIAWPDLSL